MTRKIDVQWVPTILCSIRHTTNQALPIPPSPSDVFRRFHQILFILLLVVTFQVTTLLAGLSADTVDYQREIAPLLTKYCGGCHNADDREGNLSLASYSDLNEGTPKGPILIVGQAKSSRLIRVLTGEAKPSMPPEDHQRPTPEEIEKLVQWIDVGAIGPDGELPNPYQLKTPSIQPVSSKSSAVTALELSPDGQQLAIARFGRVEFSEPTSHKIMAEITDLPGKINAIKYSSDGSQIMISTGITGVVGRADLYSVTDGKLLKSFGGHRDIVTDAEFSSFQNWIATSSYDQRILLWRMDEKKPVHEITGHNGAVFDLAFSPDGLVLASASSDETIKLWNVKTGERLDTLSQPSAEQYVVSFSPDGNSIVAGGADHRVRVWDFVSRKRPQINPLRHARFAHEGAVVALAWTPDGKNLLTASDDHSMKLWETDNFVSTHPLPKQPDVVSNLSMAASGDKVAIGRMDGSWEIYSLSDERQALVNHPTTAELVPGDDAANRLVAPETVEENSLSELVETEPNDRPEQATFFSIPALLRGTIHSPNGPAGDDVDFYRWKARAGEPLILEVRAARDNSLIDSIIEVLDHEGRRIERVVLQAVRDSYLTFQARNSDTISSFRLHNWTEMELNEYLYAQGEVCKLWFYPNGPDAGFRMYPGEGKRFTYFGTTALSHALNETCYIVEPHQPGTQLVPNGLPIFSIFHENDDDGRRRLGKDSRLEFVPPMDAEYLVRVRDVRGFGGEKYHYQLTVRKPRPDFEVTVKLDDVTIHAGSGQEFKVSVQRLDGFDAAIRLDIGGLPPGFSVTSPVIVQAGQISAFGVVYADTDAAPPAEDHAQQMTFTAVAMREGHEIKKVVQGFGNLKIGDSPKLLARVTSLDRSHDPWETNSPLELEITPGDTICARVVIQRNAHDGDVRFGGDDSGRNLPHGVYVDNIGLSGLTLTSGLNEREIFITAAKWVPETTRLFHLKHTKADKQTTLPVILHVRPRSDTTETARRP